MLTTSELVKDSSLLDTEGTFKFKCHAIPTFSLLFTVSTKRIQWTIQISCV